MLFWDKFKTTYIGRFILAGVHLAYRIREWALINLNSNHIRSWSAKKLHDWKQTRYLNPILKRDRELLHEAREKHESHYAVLEEKPLVSVIIATWNRGEILAGRTLPSVLNQTYNNFEIVIVGDCCTDNTEELITLIDDPRIRFCNLPNRGDYPKDKEACWQVAGTPPLNKAMELCRGKWIAPLDDDDVFTPNHIETLLHYAQKNDLEFLYSKLKVEAFPGVWRIKGAAKQHMSMQNSTILFRSYIKLFRADINSWRIGMTGDYMRTVRCREAGVRIGFLNEIVALMPLRPGQTQIGFLAEDRPDDSITG